jgi:RNA polymerase sigma-70 factor (ECF subfamily)
MNVNPKYHQTPDRINEELAWIKKTKEKPAFFSPLYKKYHSKIYSYVYQRMDDQDLANDITSQIFVKAIKNIHKYNDYGVPFASWLYRIAKSEVYQYFRDNKASRFVNIDSIQITEIVEDFEEQYSEFEKQKLLTALKSIKEKDMELLELRFFEKRSHKEIGEILNITENNAKIKCFRALEKLKTNYHNKQ